MIARMVLAILSVFCLLSCFASFAKCRGEQVETGYGLLTHEVCRDQQKRYTHLVGFAGAILLRSDFLVEAWNSKDRSLWVYSEGVLPATGCAAHLYLIDLAAKPPKVISFGVKNACNEFNWASWSDKRSVISLKKNVSFVYENGKLIPPKTGAPLWKSIEPPHAGPGLKFEDMVPFVEELALLGAN